MNIRDRVLRQHPSAISKSEEDGFKIYICGPGGIPLEAIGQGTSEDDAWRDAANTEALTRPTGQIVETERLR